MANNNLTTILDGSSNRLLVEKYLSKRLLERRDWGTPLANGHFGDTRGIPRNAGQYIEWTRKGRVRRPQKMSSPGSTGSDPSSGATLAGEKVQAPVEYIQDYLAIATVANQTSWVDLDRWAREDLPYALRRRAHELVQNTMLVGRMSPFSYSAAGAPSSDVDSSAEATVTLYNVSFTFQSGVNAFANGKGSFNELEPTDKITWNDLDEAQVALDLAGAYRINGSFVCVLSISMAMDLMNDDKYFAAAINAPQGKGLFRGLEQFRIVNWRGWHFIIDGQPFTMNAQAENIRADWGPIHAAFCFGAHAYGLVPLGGQRGLNPRLKMQDITKTGYEFSLGYLYPFQTAVLNPNWCRTIAGYVSVSTPNNSAGLEGFSIS